MILDLEDNEVTAAGIPFFATPLFQFQDGYLLIQSLSLASNLNWKFCSHRYHVYECAFFSTGEKCFRKVSVSPSCISLQRPVDNFGLKNLKKKQKHATFEQNEMYVFEWTVTGYLLRGAKDE